MGCPFCSVQHILLPKHLCMHLHVLEYVGEIVYVLLFVKMVVC